ncbi:MAG TPA: carbonic anhydrase family protein [Terracidiphilus sp.]|nr:carbonic anhydrase family protein [Terracidiphilus sp.]
MRFYFVAALAASMGAALAAAQTGAQWDYTGRTGPVNWDRLDPAYKACGGHEQSPIDIHGARLNKKLTPIEFHYLAGPVTLVNDGHTISAHMAHGGYIVANGVRYDLESFEFHHPSEHAVKGKLTDLDVHLIHKSADGKIAIIAIRFAMERGDPNSLLAALWPHLPRTAGATEKVTGYINPGGFLPEDRGYWTYTGSLTAPPCTEGVQWYIIQQPLTVSLEQLHEFQSIFRMNSRPLQDAHGRHIEADE